MQIKDVPLPADRTPEQLRNHFDVESALARKLKSSRREDRSAIYATMYDELFEAVPDHPRLQIRDDVRLRRQDNVDKWELVRDFVSPETVFVEFAPGACRFSYDMCEQVERVVGIDISDQTGDGATQPDNFELVIYDGYNLDIESGFADVVFSDQLLEHLHPDDTAHHFEVVMDMLKPGGIYLMRTPHKHSGPHDISMYFSDEPRGFHLKEWTYAELDQLLTEVGFTSWTPYRPTKGTMVKVPVATVLAAEKVLGAFPTERRVKLASRIYNNITMTIKK